MRPILSPLQSGDRGGPVGNLQDSLLHLIDKRLLVPSTDDAALVTALRTERQASDYGSTTTRVVTLFQERHGLRATGVIDPATADTINRLLRDLDALTPDRASLVFAVHGRVISQSRAGVNGLRITIVNKGIGGERDVVLAETATAVDGSYQARFTTAGIRRGDGPPDVQAQAFTGDTLLGASPVRYNASQHERLDISLTAKAETQLPAEWQTLTGDIGRYFSGWLRDLQENDQRTDITDLAAKTGWDARAVALAALADQFSARTLDSAGTPSLEPALFYALFRAGALADERAIYQLTPAQVIDVWKEAIARGVISADLESKLEVAAEHFERLVVQRALDGPAVDGLSSLKELLDVSLGNQPASHQRFATLQAQHRAEPAKLWEAVRAEFGPAVETRLRTDGQLAALTFNNAPLIRTLHAAAGPSGLTDIAKLVERGYYRSDAWQAAIADGEVPREVIGASMQERRQRYADLMAAQVRLSVPTLVVADMVKNDVTPTASGRREEVAAFLTTHHGRFELGMQSIQRYVARKQLQVHADVVKDIARIHRVYQLTVSDAGMNALLRRGVDSAAAVARYDREEFVRSFKDDLGGERNARLTHAKAKQIHGMVLNLATSYLVARTAPQLGVHSPPKYGKTTPNPVALGMEAVKAKQASNIHSWLIDNWAKQSAENAADVIPYATLEALFGEMDFCECEHCRSVLSPAAYLVDLLQFLDRNGQGADKNPLNILLGRRPDIAHLPLTCENTNTPLPYIDLVNETLEFFVTHNLSLQGYAGHSTDGTVTATELLASPQYVEDEAYRIVAGRHAPNQPPPLLPPSAPLPFHQPLETLRRYFDEFDAPLPEVMERLRTHDQLERPAPVDPNSPIEYGWRDILMEELRLSRAEYRLLTDRQVSLQHVYGFDPSETINDILFGRAAVLPNKPALPGLSNAKAFSRLMGLSYEELVEILKTRFVNPHSTLVPKLERLGVPFLALKALKDGILSDADFDALVTNVDPTEFGNDIKGWVKNDENYTRIMSLITLTDPTGEDSGTSFDKVELRYANPVTANTLRPFEFHRLGRFIRLWKKLGWTIEQTDKAIVALYPDNQIPNSTDDQVNLQRLDDGLLVTLPRLGVIKRLLTRLKLKTRTDLLPLLACFGPIDTHGTRSLYRQMFLSPAPAAKNSVFADDGFGNFLTQNATLFDHADAVRAALLVTDQEFTQIAASLGFNAQTPLSLTTISAVFRRGWLARKLKISVRELLALIETTGFDPFSAPDPPSPGLVRLVDLLTRLRAVGLKPELALYSVWNKDVTGTSAPGNEDVLELARVLRATFAAIDAEFALTDDPTGQIARARMTLVYGGEATNLFFGFLDNTLVTEVAYDHAQPTLEPAILQAASARISYDDFAKRLSYSGVMTEASRNALLASSTNAAFKTAVHNPDPQHESLFTKNQAIVAPFFDRYPELEPLYELHAFFGNQHTPAAVTTFFQKFSQDYPGTVVDQAAYVAAAGSEPALRSLFLQSFLPELQRRRKRQQALTVAATAAKVDLPLAIAVLDDPLVLNPALASSPPASSALDDLLVVQHAGLSARVYAGVTIGGANDPAVGGSAAEPSLAYPSTGEGALPASPASGVWTGYLEAPENGFYNIRIDAGATGGSGPGGATLTLNGTPTPLAQDGQTWSNTTAIELRAGILYAVTLRLENITAGLTVRWQTIGRGWEVIPQQYLYSHQFTESLQSTYVRFRKATSLADALKLTPGELVHFAAHEDYRIASRGWLNSVPVSGGATPAVAAQLLVALDAVVDFAALKARLSPKDERLLRVLRDPTTMIATSGTSTDEDTSALLALTRWNGSSLDALLLRFGHHLQGQQTKADRGALRHFATFMRVTRAYEPVRKVGVSAAALVATTTNEPPAAGVRDFKDALRARYEASDWLSVLKPINDEMRALQRDALVAYTLHHMRAHIASEHIDTPNKLFEYFLMDVQMASCMQTSRIRHALSAVQLFAERCFMNLETAVAPTVFEAMHRKQWEWMKRYRVWEVNRKIFLWPENEAHAELRLDASPFFKEALSELLQGDITEERAATALLNYFSKLEEVARLEPCGMHFVEGEPGVTDDVVHVVARTSGANRKYFYRQFDGIWSPWEAIKVDIEDNPVATVMWKGRLLLFWLKLLKHVETTPLTPQSGQLGTTDAAQVMPKAIPKVETRAVLCWSERFNGKWQPARTSDIDAPAFVDRTTEKGFNRSGFSIWADEAEDFLKLTIVQSTAEASHFRLTNLNSLPIWSNPPNQIYSIPRVLDTSGSSLTVEVNGTSKELLKTSRFDRTIQPQHALERPELAPFFYADDVHVFYVTPQKVYVPVQGTGSYGTSPSDFAKAVPELVVMKQAPGDGDPDPVLSADPNVLQRFVSEDAYIKKAIPMKQTVTFGNRSIGIKGTAASVIEED
jgi:Neuraminidase-like domain/Salmonella virulence plasmid 28.1kDa A protein/Putative peptidoglycan binding domain